MVIDTHCHLNDDKFSFDYKNIINNAKNENLKSIIIVGADLQSSKKALFIAEQFDNVYAIIGSHPEDADNFSNEAFDFYKQNSSNKKVVGIGEIGLDYFYNKENKDKQKEILIKQIKLAYERKLPICFHLRDAYEDFIKIVNDNKQFLIHGGVIHCYSGSLEYAKELINFGFKLGIDGPITFKNNKKTVEVVQNLDISHFIVETDSPYLSPEPVRGTRNEPKNINFIVRKIAEIKNMSVKIVEQQLLKNTLELYKKIKF